MGVYSEFEFKKGAIGQSHSPFIPINFLLLKNQKTGCIKQPIFYSQTMSQFLKDFALAALALSIIVTLLFAVLTIFSSNYIEEYLISCFFILLFYLFKKFME